jgi:hypothetical protein
MDNEFQSAIDEITYDHIDHLIHQKDQLSRIIQADDILELESDLIPHDPESKARKLPLLPKFLDHMRDKHDSKRKLLKYRSRTLSPEYLSILDYEALAIKGDYKPIFHHYCKPDPYTTFEYSDNRLSFRIEKLHSFTQSRYKTLVRSAVDSGLFLPNHRTPTSHKNTMEAIRSILKRRFYIKRYEWALIFNSDSSEVIFSELTRLSKLKNSGVKLVKNTFYLHDCPRSQCKIKVYNIDSAQAERVNQPPEFRPGDRLKFEITYKTRFFNDYPLLSLSRFTFQAFIADNIYSHNKKQLGTHLLNKFSPTALRLLYKTVTARGRDEFMKTFESNMTTQTSIDRIDADIKALKATLSAHGKRLDTQDKRLDALEALLGASDSKKVTNKLRSVC